MIIGVISDTHGNRALMHRAAAQLTEQSKADCIVHLGDDYRDGEELAMAGYPVEQVPGLWCPAYRNPRVPNMRVLEADGVKVAFAHDVRDIRGPGRTAQVVLVGHTHEAGVEVEHGVIHVNPGHLKGSIHRGEHPSYAVLRVSGAGIEVSIHELNGSVRESAVFARADLAS